MRKHKLGIITLLVAIGVGVESGNAAKPPPPVKVFILAGQSNMLGPASVTTFDYIGDDPATAPLLKKMRNADGTPKVCDHVWISMLSAGKSGSGEGFGKLTAGYGMRKDPKVNGGMIGPEFTFGLRMDEKLAQPILLIKTAWGGKTLSGDFRPPSAGPTGADPEKTGKYYRLMIEHVRMVLKDIKRVMPDYDPQQGYELGGFVWLQGWNDMVDKYTYPDTAKGNPYAKYSGWLADFIRDVRKDLNAPDLPFVIGVAGFSGANAKGRMLDFREAMAAPAALPEFKGRVIAVPTAPFWDDRLDKIFEKQWRGPILKKELDKQVQAGKLTQAEAEKQIKEMTPTPEEIALGQRGRSNKGYHYLGCAKTFALMGQAFADALLPLQKP